MTPAKLATRPMATTIPLAAAVVTAVNHGNGAGFGLLVDGVPTNIMLLPTGEVDRYNVIVAGVWGGLTVPMDEALRWAPVLARSYQTITGSINGHTTPAVTAPKPAARVRPPRPRATGGATAKAAMATPAAPKPARPRASRAKR